MRLYHQPNYYRGLIEQAHRTGREALTEPDYVGGPAVVLMPGELAALLDRIEHLEREFRRVTTIKRSA